MYHLLKKYKKGKRYAFPNCSHKPYHTDRELTKVKNEVTVTRQNGFPIDQVREYYAFHVSKRIHMTNQCMHMQLQVSAL